MPVDLGGDINLALADKANVEPIESDIASFIEAL